MLFVRYDGGMNNETYDDLHPLDIPYMGAGIDVPDTYELYLHVPGVSEMVRIHHVTSDTHIGHRNIAKYTGRPYVNDENTDDMDADLVRLWNEVVAPGENVLHLGDAALGQISESIKWYGKMNGNKFLVPGNHDYISSVSTQSRRERYAEVYAGYFTVLPETVTVIANKGKQKRTMRACHYPSIADPREGGKYQSLRPPAGDGVPLIHGHTHYKEVLNPMAPYEFHAGIDAHGLKPVSAYAISEWAFSLPAPEDGILNEVWGLTPMGPEIRDELLKMARQEGLIERPRFDWKG